MTRRCVILILNRELSDTHVFIISAVIVLRGGVTMEFYIGNVTERTAPGLSEIRASDSGGFQSELAGALGKRSEMTEDNFCGYPGVVISPKIEEKLRSDPEYSELLSKKLKELLHGQSENLKNSVVIVDKNGEITQHCFSRDREDRHPTAEELKEVAKARARKKARLDAYFRLLERVSIKRKLIEQENAKRFAGKKYRFSVSCLDIIARSRKIAAPPPDPDYFS